MVNAIDKIKSIDCRIKTKTSWSIYELIILFACICAGAIMLLRCFFGTEITDEAYYVADAKAMLEGNLPYAYCNYSVGSGSAFLLIPLIAVYRIFQPELAGVFLYSRICYCLFWYSALFVIYRILRKSVTRSSALCFVGLLIPYKAGVNLMNFSYNTVPCVLALLAAFILYDVIENNGRGQVFKLITVGFLCGIAFFAQPGYAMAILVFGILVLVRSKGIKLKVRNALLCIAGGVCEVCVVYIPIIIQAGVKTTLDGISRYINPYPSNNTMSSTTRFSRLMSILNDVGRDAIIIAVTSFVLYFLLKRYVAENEKRLSKREYILIAVLMSVFRITWGALGGCIKADFIVWKLGVLGSILLCVFVTIGVYKEQIILLYVGIYPILFAVGEAIYVDSGISIGRFVATVPTLAVCFLCMLEEKSEILRLLTTGLIVLCTFELGLAVCTYIYRDEDINHLRYKVESGVYKGIYTTDLRAVDLPELEEYLNAYIEDGEYYEFHDNVPAGYLMMHTGEMCSRATWDSLNYTYEMNAPAELYEYYRRRGVIPDKLFYVDYGRDDNLSIEDSEFKYNEFVNTYYKKIDEVNLNKTFYHVIVYEYIGGFDNDYDYWIDKHMVRE